jgi:hypothetical protein
LPPSPALNRTSTSSININALYYMIVFFLGL